MTGLYYFRTRWYNAETGRWLSKDPKGITGGFNLYVFCDNNPVNLVDPSGLVCQVSGNGANITIAFPIRFTGDAISMFQRNQIIQGITNLWSGVFNNLNVTMNVVEAALGVHANNFVMRQGVGRSYTTGTTVVLYTEHPDGAPLAWVAAHEAGHNMGIMEHQGDGIMADEPIGYFVPPTAQDMSDVISRN